MPQSSGSHHGEPSESAAGAVTDLPADTVRARERTRGSSEARAMTVTLSLERERKLSVGRSFRLPDLQGTPLPPRLLTSTYFDTEGYRLAAAGITLRRRVQERRSCWQLKLPCAEGRYEVEAQGGPGRPPAQLLDPLFAHLRGSPVAPVVTMRTWRTGTRIVTDGRPVAEVVLDAVSVLVDRHVVMHFREAEIELLDGDETVLDRLEGRLRQAGAADHDGRPKMFRALDLPLQEPVPPVPQDAPIIDHLRALLSAQVISWLRHDPLVRIGKSVEAVHQMRVATRRLRALLRAARPLLVPEWSEQVRSELSWLAGVLGPARDLDVLIGYFQQELATLEKREAPPVRRLIRKLRRDREAVQEDLVSTLRSDRYLAALDLAEAGSRQPQVTSSDVSLHEIAAAEFRKLRKSVRALPESPSDEELHRVRIKVKRARYAAELAETTVGRPASRFIQRAKELQDILGMHQDAVVAEGRVRLYLDGSQSRTAAFAAGRMVERQHQRKLRAREQFAFAWKKLEKRGKKVWG
ncbi:MAG TPA: CYTH and CHAD domain-containing protein [Nitrospiraceae bacterium]|nr:CYTH and CHAD domain-containing protein [Nitrospiraceae bacterium]